MAARLILYTTSIKSSDVHTFKAAARRLKTDYQKNFPNDDVSEHYIKSGSEIIKVINNQAIGSIASLDIISHGNQGGIHIAQKLAKSVESGFIQKRAHVEIRRNSDRPQTREQAEYIEESMHGLYTDWSAKKGVSYYYNQTYAGVTNTAYLSDINSDRFLNGAFVEFHGCRTAEVILGFNNLFKDNFSKQFSDKLMLDVTVVGHITNSNPNKTPTGKFSDYRHGRINVYKNGDIILENVLRQGQYFENSSTPRIAQK